jgi:hypothetical protein
MNIVRDCRAKQLFTASSRPGEAIGFPRAEAIWLMKAS